MTSHGDSRVPPFYRFFRDLHTDDRGQSEAIGAVLLIGLAVVGTAGIVAFGSTAISDTEQFVDSETAAHTMGQMSSQAAEVALGESESQTVELPRGEGADQSQVVDDGWMKMEVINESNGEVEDVIFNESLGAVVYESGDESVAYQGGGVWKQTGNSSEMVSPPQFHYREDTLTVPVIQVQGEGHITGDATIRKNGSTERLYPNETAGHTNPFSGTNETIRVVVHSEYYDAWGEFFETRTDGEADVDHDDRTATLTLVAEEEEHVVESAVGSTSANGELSIAGTGARTDSYNSTEGPYEQSQGFNGSIVAAGDVDMAGGGEVHGDIHTGSTFEIGGNAYVNGSVRYSNAFEDRGNYDIEGTVERPAEVASMGSIDGHVETQANQTKSEDNNNNDAADVIQDERLDFGAGTELGPGDYYLKDLVVPEGETLLIKTEDETVRIGIRDYIRIDGGAIEVEGEGTVEIYVEGETTTTGGNHLYVDDGGTVEVPHDRSTQFWVYGKEQFSAELISAGSSDPARFQGVIYAPAAIDRDGGEVTLNQHAELYGAVMAGSTTMENRAAIHFDEAVQKEEVIPEDTTIVIVNYVHATLNTIDVEDT